MSVSDPATVQAVAVPWGSSAPSDAPASEAATLGERRTLVRFVVSSAAANVAALAGTALALRWIEPAAMGVWQTLLLASSYLTIVRFGLISGLGRELPFAAGCRDRGRADEIASTAVFYNTLCSGVVGIAFLAALPFFWSSGPSWRVALPAVAVFSATGLYLAYLQATYRSDRDFARLARIQLVQASLALLLPFSVWAFGFVGLCVHTAVQTVAVTALAHVFRPFPVRARFDPKVAWQLVATGLPLFIGGYLQTVAAGFDRVILLWRGTVESVGYYTPAIAVIAAMAIVPAALSTYVYPRMSYALGQGHRREVLGGMAFRATALSIAATLPIAFVGWWAAPTIVAAFFPQYTASIPAIRWSLWAGLFWSFTPATQALGTLKAWRALAVYVGLLLATRWSFPWIFSGRMDPVEGVALGNLVAAVVLAAASMILVANATRICKARVTS